MFSSRPLNLERNQWNQLLPEFFVAACACEVLQIFVKDIECVVVLSSSCMNDGNIA